MTSHIAENFAEVESTIDRLAPDRDVRLVVAVKYADVEQTRAVLEAGATELGANYPQDAIDKFEAVSEYDFRRHMIGPVQSNKANDIWGNFDLVQTLAREKLIGRYRRTRPEGAAPLPVLVQVNIGEEEQKHGVPPGDTLDFCKRVVAEDALSLRGLMCIPPKPEVPEDSRPHFERMVELHRQAKRELSSPDDPVGLLSMGMSTDLEVALECGANMVRVGSRIFSP